jgi:hypothetical protein
VLPFILHSFTVFVVVVVVSTMTEIPVSIAKSGCMGGSNREQVSAFTKKKDKN